jgi:predicted TIM-barrel fold metal-dependent hydrolase
MLIVDSQVHVWGPNTPERPWQPGPVHPHRDPPLGAEELLGLMDEAGVDRAILLPPSWDGKNDLVLEAAEAHPDRFAVMGRIDHRAPDAPEQVANWRKQPGMLGMRLSFNRAVWTPALTNGEVDWLWAAAEKARVPVTLMIRQDLVGIVDGIAERHPDLKISLCHMALTSGRSFDDTFADFDKVLPIARRPNVAVKVSALPGYANDSYPYRSLQPYLRKAYDAFGPKRMFWGTDLARLPCTYRQSVTMITDEIDWLSAEDKEWIMGRGLSEWLGWAMPGAKKQ